MDDDDWETTPRLLWEQCEGHGGTMIEVYALDLPNGVRLWLCKPCWIDCWIGHGKPEQTAVRGRPA